MKMGYSLFLSTLIGGEKCPFGDVFLVFGVWCLVLGAWCLVLGT